MHGWGGCADWLTVVDGTMFQSGTEGILECYICEPQSRELWEPSHDVHVKGKGTDRLVQAVLNKLDEFWPANQYYNGSANVFQWVPYIPNYPPGFVRDGRYAELGIPIGRIHFVGDYIYGPGLESAVHTARDVTAQFV
jgi:protoporphyrinogen oxidase